MSAATTRRCCTAFEARLGAQRPLARVARARSSRRGAPSAAWVTTVAATRYYGRNGWCDGQDVAPLVWDVTDAVLGGGAALPGAFDLTYYALSYSVGGRNPSEGGCGGHIIMNAHVSFYAQ